MKSVLAIVALVSSSNAVQIIPEEVENIMLSTGIRSFAQEIAEVNDNAEKL